MDEVAPKPRVSEKTVYAFLTLLLIAAVGVAGVVGIPEYIFWLQRRAAENRMEILQHESEVRLRAIRNGCVPNDSSTECLP